MIVELGWGKGRLDGWIPWQGQATEVVSGCPWLSTAGKTARNIASHTASANRVEAVLGLCRTSCRAFGGCPRWWKCWGVLRRVGGGGG